MRITVVVSQFVDANDDEVVRSVGNKEGELHSKVIDGDENVRDLPQGVSRIDLKKK